MPTRGPGAHANPAFGAWRRRSVVVGDGPPFETQEVRYVQTSADYADLRVGLADPTSDQASFAGTCTWNPPWAAWSHDLDLEPTSRDDHALLTRSHDGALEERGTWRTAAGELAYTEVWQPLPGARGPVLALRGDRPLARLVRVGDHAIVVVDERAQGGEHRARYERFEGGRWWTEVSIGDAADLPSPPEVMPTPSTELDLGGLRWRVVEARPA